MQHITLAEVKQAGRDYYNRGRLTAQHPTPHKRDCVYESGQYRCVIGTVLNDKTLAAMSDRCSHDLNITHQEHQGIVSFDPVEQDALLALQHAHDKWCQASQNNNDPTDMWETHDEFKKLLFAD
jgi:hypothetical protein